MKVIYIFNENHESLLSDLSKFFGALQENVFTYEKGNVVATIYKDNHASILAPLNFDASIFSSKQIFPEQPEHEYAGFEYKRQKDVTRSRVEKDIKFGQETVLEYLIGNKTLDTKVEDSIAQAQKFGGVKMLLESGAIEAARAVLSEVPPDNVFTEERKAYFINRLTTYLNDPN